MRQSNFDKPVKELASAVILLNLIGVDGRFHTEIVPLRGGTMNDKLLRTGEHVLLFMHLGLL